MSAWKRPTLLLVGTNFSTYDMYHDWAVLCNYLRATFMAIFLGLDSSTQGLYAIAIDFDAKKVLLEHQIDYEKGLPQFGCVEGKLPHNNKAIAHADPLMWVAALDFMFKEIRDQGFDLGKVQAISGSGQQHGSVYLNFQAEKILASLDPVKSLDQQLAAAMTRKTAPIWMDSSTDRQCREIEHALGGPDKVAEMTGSRCFERFTGPQIRKYYQEDPLGYERTARIHLVSSFMASVLAGKHAPIDHGDGAGMNLMDIRAKHWAPKALEATAPNLAVKLPPLARSDAILGNISAYFVKKYGFSPQTQVAAWSGDNPCSLIGLGLISPGKVAISLGTSDTYFGFMPEPRISQQGEGHVFGSPTGDYMTLICFLNGSLTREDVMKSYGLNWDGFSAALKRSPAGNHGKVLLPYYRPEITPTVLRPKVYRYGLNETDLEGNVRGVIEAQMASMAIHSRWMGVKTKTIHATGGASQNREILQVMADVHDAEVFEFPVTKSAGLGAALRAAHASMQPAGHTLPWDKVVEQFTDPKEASRVTPNPKAVAIYKDFLKLYQACEQHALKGGPEPKEIREGFSSLLGKK